MPRCKSKIIYNPAKKKRESATKPKNQNDVRKSPATDVREMVDTFPKSVGSKPLWSGNTNSFVDPNGGASSTTKQDTSQDEGIPLHKDPHEEFNVLKEQDPNKLLNEDNGNFYNSPAMLQVNIDNSAKPMIPVVENFGSQSQSSSNGVNRSSVFNASNEDADSDNTTEYDVGDDGSKVSNEIDVTKTSFLGVMTEFTPLPKSRELRAKQPEFIVSLLNFLFSVKASPLANPSKRKKLDFVDEDSLEFKLRKEGLIDDPINWLSKQKLLPKLNIHLCRTCGMMLTLKEDDKKVDKFSWMCANFKCAKRYSIPRCKLFSKLRSYSLSDLVAIVYHWSFQSRYEEVQKDCNLAPHQIFEIWKEVQNVCAAEVRNCKLGLQNLVEVSYIKFAKYLIVGAMERGTRFSRLTAFPVTTPIASPKITNTLSGYFKVGTTVITNVPQVKELNKRGIFTIDYDPNADASEHEVPNGHVRDIHIYLQDKIQMLFGSCSMDQLNLELLQMILNNLQWRERYGRTNEDAFWNVIYQVSGKKYQLPYETQIDEKDIFTQGFNYELDKSEVTLQNASRVEFYVDSLSNENSSVVNGSILMTENDDACISPILRTEEPILEDKSIPVVASKESAPSVESEVNSNPEEDSSTASDFIPVNATEKNKSWVPSTVKTEKYILLDEIIKSSSTTELEDVDKTTTDVTAIIVTPTEGNSTLISNVHMESVDVLNTSCVRIENTMNSSSVSGFSNNLLESVDDVLNTSFEGHDVLIKETENTTNSSSISDLSNIRQESVDDVLNTSFEGHDVLNTSFEGPDLIKETENTTNSSSISNLSNVRPESIEDVLNTSTEEHDLPMGEMENTINENGETSTPSNDDIVDTDVQADNLVRDEVDPSVKSTSEVDADSCILMDNKETSPPVQCRADRPTTDDSCKTFSSNQATGKEEDGVRDKPSASNSENHDSSIPVPHSTDVSISDLIAIRTWPILCQPQKNCKNLTVLQTEFQEDLKRQAFFLYPEQWFLSQKFLPFSGSCKYCGSTDFVIKRCKSYSYFYGRVCTNMRSVCPINLFKLPELLQDHNLNSILKVVFHWTAQSDVPDVLESVDVTASCVWDIYTKIREVCSAALDKSCFVLGKEHGVVKSTIVQCGIYFMLLCEDVKTDLRRMKLYKIEELKSCYIVQDLKSWCDRSSLILGYFPPSVEKHLSSDCELLSSVVTGCKAESVEQLTELATTVIITLFDKCINSQLDLKMMQSFVDEVVWRQIYGVSSSSTFVNLFKQIITGDQKSGKALDGELASDCDVISMRGEKRKYATASCEDNRTRSSHRHKHKKLTYHEAESMSDSHTLLHKYHCFICTLCIAEKVVFMDHIYDHMKNIKTIMIKQKHALVCKNPYSDCRRSYRCSFIKERSKMDKKQCSICQMHFPCAADLDRHLTEIHGTSLQPYACDLCDFRSAQYSATMSHFRMDHADRADLLCPYCMQSFPLQMAADAYNTKVFCEHLLSHENSTPLNCLSCSLVFVSKSSFSSHQKHHRVSRLHPAKDKMLNRKSTAKHKKTKRKILAPSLPASNGNPETSLTVRINGNNAEVCSSENDNHKYTCLECRQILTENHKMEYMTCQCLYTSYCYETFLKHSHRQLARGQNHPKPFLLKTNGVCECGFMSKDGMKLAFHALECHNKYIVVGKRLIRKKDPSLQGSGMRPARASTSKSFHVASNESEAGTIP